MDRTPKTLEAIKKEVARGLEEIGDWYAEAFPKGTLEARMITVGSELRWKLEMVPNYGAPPRYIAFKITEHDRLNYYEDKVSGLVDKYRRAIREAHSEPHPSRYS